MKRITILILLLLFTANLRAQINDQLIYGTWIKVKVTYNDDKPLVYANIFKYSYAKYIFTSTGKVGINTGYETTVANNSFLTNDSTLIINSPLGFKMNEFHIAKLTGDELVLVQDNGDGYDKPDAWKIYLIPEKTFQKIHPFKNTDITIMANGDTVYKESPYIYATSTADGGFQNYMQNNISKAASMDGQEGNFKADFIITKTGKVDSLDIINGINPDYQKAFLKFFAKCQLNWQPALLNDKPVNVRMRIMFNYFTSDKMTPAMHLTTDAENAFKQGQYDIALHFYEESFQYRPDDIESIYKSTLCKLALGKADGVCDDLQKINASGTMIVDELINLVCTAKK